MKWIAISQRVQIITSYGERRDALAQDWIALAKECGFLPLLLPNDRDTVSQMLQAMKPAGIILSGGNDLTAYGGDAPERDEMEHYLVEYAIRTQTPLLGVCRGTQLILDHFGTSLEKVENHVGVNHLLDSGETVNSFHSWGTHACKAPLKVVHYSQDGIVEEIVHEEYNWIRGLMWHPERYHPMRPQDMDRIKEVFSL